jgi:MFS family permease
VTTQAATALRRAQLASVGTEDTTSNPGRTLAIAASGTLLVLAVFSAAVTSVGDSGRELHAGIAGDTWTLSGMSLGLAVALLTLGTIADEYGRRRVLTWSAGLLAVGGALGAVSPSIGVLVAARIVQGAAGAGLVAASLGMIGHAFPAGRERTHAAAVWGASVGAGIAVGPLLGAAIAAGMGWRSSYWLEAVAAAALVPASLTLPESRSATARPLDVPGAITLAAAMGALTGGLVEGRTDWTSTTTLALLAAGVALLVAFVAIERTRRHPMVELHLFGQPLFVASIAGALFTGLAVIGLMSYSVPFLEDGLHVSVAGGAAVLLSWSATSMLTSLAARRLPDRVPVNLRLALGLTLTAVGELALTGLNQGSSPTRLIPGLVIAGIGSGVANAALGRLAVESVPRDRVSMGSGANNTARYLGGAAGIALLVAIASGGGSGHALISGWNTAALVSAVLCVLGAAIAALCRSPGRQDS